MSLAPRAASRAYLAAVVAFTAFVAVAVVQQLSGSILGVGDINLWAHQGHYVGRHLHLLPWPRLDLVTDDTLYPWGTSQVFQPWGFEREMFWALLERAAGDGPWMQLYYLGTLVASAFGGYLLLARDYGPGRAALASFAVTFANYYALLKFPVHLHAACVHWITLGLFADAVLLGRCWDGRPWTARLVLARIALLALSAGLDLGYVFGLGVLEFGLAAATAAAMLALRPRSRASVRWRALADSARRHPAQCAALAGLAVFAGWLYVPLVLQVSREVGRFDFAQVPNPPFHMSPYRLLLPVLPGLNPLDQFRSFADPAEFPFQGSPGLAFVAAGAIGLVAGRRRWAVMLPFVALLALCVWGHDLLMRLPWLRFARIQARWTVVYPVVLAIMGLQIPSRWLAKRPGRAVATACVLLLAIEMTTAYRRALTRPKVEYFRPDPAFYAFMDTVRRTPGEAVMEWPFCIVGGNSVGLRELCPFYGRVGGKGHLQRLHGKKTVGFYFGRLHPSQIAPFVEAGWADLFAPDTPDPRRATRQTRDFTPAEWERFLAFYREHDFAGLIVYPELLPPETRARLVLELGPPAASAWLPGQDTPPAHPPVRAEFFPRAR